MWIPVLTFPDSQTQETDFKGYIIPDVLVCMCNLCRKLKPLICIIFAKQVHNTHVFISEDYLTDATIPVGQQFWPEISPSIKYNYTQSIASTCKCKVKIKPTVLFELIIKARNDQTMII